MSKHKYTSHKYKRKLEVKNGLKTCKSPGPDGLNPRCTSITLLLHELANLVYLPLSIIFEASLKSNTIPEQWKLQKCLLFIKRELKVSKQLQTSAH